MLEAANNTSCLEEKMEAKSLAPNDISIADQNPSCVSARKEPAVLSEDLSTFQSMSHWSALESALLRMKKAQDSPATHVNNTLENTVSVPYSDKEEKESLDQEEEKLASNKFEKDRNNADPDNLEERASQEIIPQNTPSPDRAKPLTNQLIELHSLIDTYGNRLSTKARDHLISVFPLLEQHIEALPACASSQETDQHVSPLSDKDVSQLCVALTRMIAVLEHKSASLTPDTIYEMALKVQNLAIRLYRIVHTDTPKEDLKHLLGVVETLTQSQDFSLTANQDRNKQKLLNQKVVSSELNQWKQSIETSLNSHHKQVEGLIQELILERLDALAGKMFNIAEAKKIPQNEGTDSASEISHSELEKQVRSFLELYPTHHAELIHKVNEIKGSVQETQDVLLKPLSSLSDLSALLTSLKQKLAQLNLLEDETRQKKNYELILKSVEDLKASSFASSQSVHSALLDLEEELKTVALSLKKSEHSSQDTDHRLTYAIRKIQRNNSLDQVSGNNPQSGAEPNQLRSRLIEAVRSAPALPETPPSKSEEKTIKQNTTFKEDDNRALPVLDSLKEDAIRGAVVEVLLEERKQEAYNQELERHDLEQRISILKKIKSSLGKRWSA